MPTKRSYNYEAMFLIGQNVAADLTGVIQHINEVLARGNAEVIAMRKWDERRLAYEIRGQKRGLYILVYFRAPGPDVAHIERDCNLSEQILRSLILRADHFGDVEMEKFKNGIVVFAEKKPEPVKPAAGPDLGVEVPDLSQV